MGGSVSQVFHSGSVLLSTSHGHRVSDSTKQKVQTIFDALRANPKVSVQRLEGLLQQIPKYENILTVHDEGGYNLLQKCVGANNVDLVRWLLNRHSSADVNRCPCSLPLHIACLKGHHECVDLLLKHGAKVDVEARMCWPGPHSSNCEERGKYRKLCVFTSDILLLTANNFFSEFTIFQNVVFRSRKPLLHAACERGAWRCTQFLVTERSEEIHILKDEYYPIHYAVLHDSKFLELLINAGADTTVRTCTQQMTLLHVGEPNMVGRDGSVPIMICLVPLINKDPLHHFTHSMKVCYLNCIRILLKKGANPNCSYKLNLTPLHVLVFTISENITLNCGTQKSLNFEFIKTLLILLLTHGLDPNVKVSIRTQHILQSCMDMIQNVRDCKDIHYVYDLTLTLIQYGANPDLSLNMSEAIKNYPPHQLQSTWKTKNYILYYFIMLISRKEHLITDPDISFAKIIMLFYLVMQHKPLFECLKILYTQQLSLVPGRTTEPLTYIIRDLYKRPRTLKQICRVKIHNCLHRKPGLYINKLNLPTQMKDYLLNFEP
ncbi:ankyrin-3-like protein [Holotrichia oblita]|uniref:Ankyrin-3-like protein n=1 Tax=Holotrichia oblita TaxID=644536 RepID=A0ACB9TDS0_HOLOL|nr:ankyrin-3-like protein [Holotrichia oblita]